LPQGFVIFWVWVACNFHFGQIWLTIFRDFIFGAAKRFRKRRLTRGTYLWMFGILGKSWSQRFEQLH